MNLEWAYKLLSGIAPLTKVYSEIKFKKKAEYVLIFQNIFKVTISNNKRKEVVYMAR